MLIVISKVLIAIFLKLIIGSFLNCGLLDPELKEINQDNIIFSPERFFDEYETNKTADENRKGKRITISGKISKVGKDYIDLDANRYFGVIRKPP